MTGTVSRSCTGCRGRAPGCREVLGSPDLSTACRFVLSSELVPPMISVRSRDEVTGKLKGREHAVDGPWHSLASTNNCREKGVCVDSGSCLL